MQIDKKILAIGMGALLLLILVAVWYYISSFSQQQTPAPTLTPNDQAIQAPADSGPKTIENTLVDDGAAPVPGAEEVTQRPVAQIDLERMAKSFAERFGSFSNQSNYANIRDLKLFMSDKMEKWADAYVEKNKKSDAANQVYYGLTTKSVSAKAEKFDEAAGQASVVVDTRRREAIGTTNNSSRLYNQSIRVSFVKENGAWKVDSAFWIE